MKLIDNCGLQAAGCMPHGERWLQSMQVLGWLSWRHATHCTQSHIDIRVHTRIHTQTCTVIHTHTHTVSHTHIQSIRPSISINFIRFERLMHKSGQSDVAGCSLELPLNGQTKEVFSRGLKVGREWGTGQRPLECPLVFAVATIVADQ